MGHPLTLSDEQLNLVLDAAKRWRVRFRIFEALAYAAMIFILFAAGYAQVGLPT